MTWSRQQILRRERDVAVVTDAGLGGYVCSVTTTTRLCGTKMKGPAGSIWVLSAS